MPKLSREGTFTATVMETNVRKSERSESVGIGLKFVTMHEKMPDGEWGETDQSYEIWRSVYVIGSDQTPITFAVEQLVQSLGWSGKLSDHAEMIGPNCQIVVAEKEYQGKRSMDVAFINPYDSEGGGSSGANPDEIKQLDAQYGSVLRAAAGGGAAAAPKEKKSSKPKAPPKKTGPAANPTVDLDDDDTPF